MSSAKNPIIWSRKAENDLLEIWSYLARKASHEVANGQLRAIDQATQRLREWPFSGRARDELRPSIRSVVVNPFVVFYRVTPAAVEIVRVLHSRRDIDAIFSASGGR